MSLAEVKESIARMNIGDRLEIAALIAHLNRADDPEYQAELDGRMAAMDSGSKIDATTIERLHNDLTSRGEKIVP